MAVLAVSDCPDPRVGRLQAARVSRLSRRPPCLVWEYFGTTAWGFRARKARLVAVVIIVAINPWGGLVAFSAFYPNNGRMPFGGALVCQMTAGNKAMQSKLPQSGAFRNRTIIFQHPVDFDPPASWPRLQTKQQQQATTKAPPRWVPMSLLRSQSPLLTMR